MLNDIDLKKLARTSSNDRAFLSIYLSDPENLKQADKIIENIKKMLKGKEEELEHFEENLKMVRQYLKENPYNEGYICIFCCWLNDFFEAHYLEVPAGDFVRVDSSPYIRPLAELKDEFENFAVVITDNTKTRIHLVTSGTEEDDEKITGNVKNHVRVGGWSQQRYERRRDKQKLLYAKEIVDKLAELDRNNEFRRIIMVGSIETLNEIKKVMPDHLKKQVVGEKALDLSKGDDYINQEIYDMFIDEEKKSEISLWEQIKEQYMRDQLAVIGIEDVLQAAKNGRVEKALITRNVIFDGIRCRDCENLFLDLPSKCPYCESESVFKVDLINEIVEILESTGGEIDFTDGIEELEEVGDVAALLRW